MLPYQTSLISEIIGDFCLCVCTWVAVPGFQTPQERAQLVWHLHAVHQSVAGRQLHRLHVPMTVLAVPSRRHPRVRCDNRPHIALTLISTNTINTHTQKNGRSQVSNRIKNKRHVYATNDMARHGTIRSGWLILLWLTCNTIIVKAELILEHS